MSTLIWVSDTPDSVNFRCDNHFSKRPTWSQMRVTCGPAWPCSMRGLPGPSALPQTRCALTAPFHPYPCGRYVSVALSIKWLLTSPPFRMAHYPVESGSSSPCAELGRERLSGIPKLIIQNLNRITWERAFYPLFNGFGTMLTHKKGKFFYLPFLLVCFTIF